MSSITVISAKIKKITLSQLDLTIVLNISLMQKFPYIILRVVRKTKFLTILPR